MSTVKNDTPLFNTTEPDFAGLDPEQVRLMGEQLIVLDRDDKPVGTASKSVCECWGFPVVHCRMGAQ